MAESNPSSEFQDREGLAEPDVWSARGPIWRGVVKLNVAKIGNDDLPPELQPTEPTSSPSPPVPSQETDDGGAGQ